MSTAPELSGPSFVSAAIGTLAAALAKAQAEFPPLPRTKTVSVRTERGTYTFSYAPLEEILALTRPALGAHGLALTQLFEGPAIRTLLVHESGEWITSLLPFPTMPAKAQELGSLITYTRRYAVVSILGVAAEDDDDANAADGNAAQSNAKAQAEPEAPAASSLASKAQVAKITGLLKEMSGRGEDGYSAARNHWDRLRAEHGIGKLEELTKPQASKVIDELAAK